MAPTLLHTLRARELSTGAKAGVGIAIALAALILVGAFVFLIVRYTRQKHLNDIEHTRAVFAGEKGKAEMKRAQSMERPDMPKRKKSVKDRLKGPLYNESMDDLPAMPPKPFAEGSSPRPSFSSKRGTRMMMFM